MNYDKLVDELIEYTYDNGFRREEIKEIIRKHVEEPTLKLVIDSCKVRNVVTGEIK